MPTQLQAEEAHRAVAARGRAFDRLSPEAKEVYEGSAWRYPGCAAALMLEFARFTNRHICRLHEGRKQAPPVARLVTSRRDELERVTEDLHRRPPEGEPEPGRRSRRALPSGGWGS